MGVDTKGRGRVRLCHPEKTAARHVIGDSREGWTAALARLLDAYTGRGTLPAILDFLQIRPRGALLHSFGGRASEPEPLQAMLTDLSKLYNLYIGEKVDRRPVSPAVMIILANGRIISNFEMRYRGIPYSNSASCGVA